MEKQDSCNSRYLIGTSGYDGDDDDHTDMYCYSHLKCGNLWWRELLFVFNFMLCYDRNDGSFFKLTSIIIIADGARFG